MNYWQTPLIRLRSVEPEDAATFQAWNEDVEMSNNLDFVWPPGSMAAQKQWAEKAALERPQDGSNFFVIENNAGEAVGMISTHACDKRCGTFRYGVAVRKEFQGKGYAKAAVRLVLKYYFEELRYQKVNVEIHEDNLGSIKLHESLGYQLEGKLRRLHYHEGKYIDVLQYGLTKEEFEEKERHSRL
jgi:RimJ/RimL family protein N-acetyltransferase